MVPSNMFFEKVPRRLLALWPKLQKSSERAWVRWLFTGLLIVLVALSLGLMLYNSRDVLFSYDWQLRPVPLLVSFIFYSWALALAILVWGLLINHLSGKRSWLRHIRIYCLTNLAQRLPGILWYVLGRMAMYQQDGVSKRTISIGSGLELLVLVVSGLIVSLITWPLLAASNSYTWLGPIGGIFLGLLLLHPRTIGWILARFDIQHSLWNYRQLMVWLSIYVIIWILGGIILFSIINIVYPLPLTALPSVIAAWSASGVIATVATFTPSSFGLREVTLSAMLTPLMPSGIAVIIAIATRALITSYEIIWALVTSRLFRSTTRE